MAGFPENQFGSGLKPPEEGKLDEYGLQQSDYIKAAFNWQYNWIGIAGASAFAVVSGTVLPLVLAAGVELMYLALVPQNSRFRRLVRSWKHEDEKKERQKRLNALYKELPPEMRSRYTFVDEVVKGITTNYSHLSSTSQMFSKQMEDKLTGLRRGYLRLLHAAHTHREYLKGVFADQVRQEIEALEKGLDQEAAKVKEINSRRIEILRKRLLKFEKIRENREVIDAQCAAMEDVLQLIRDQSVTMRDPQEVSAQLDSLVQDVEQTEQDVREVEAIFALASPEATDDLMLPPGADESQSQQPRTRLRN